MGVITNALKKAFPYFDIGSTLPSVGSGLGSSIAAFLLQASSTTKDPVVTEDDAIKIMAVFACVRVIAFEMSANPIYYMRYDDATKGKYRQYGTKLFDVLRYEPNPEMSANDFKRTMQFQLELWGNAYAEIQRNRIGEIIALWPIPSERVKKKRDTKTGEISYKVQTDDNGTISLEDKSVFHLRGLGDGLTGMRPIALARNALNLAINSEKYGSDFFKNGANASGICTYPEALNDEAYKRFKESFTAEYTGLSQQQKIMFLEEGMKFEQLTIPNDSAQFIETRTYQALEVCRLFGVPPHKIGILDKATFSNIEHQGMDFDRQCILPRTVQWEEEMRRSLLTDTAKKAGDFFKINLDNRYRVSMEAKTDYYNSMKQNGNFSTNDVRELEDMNPISDEQGGNEYFINGNMIPLRVAMQQRMEGGEQNKNVGV